jgi:hypothetical protein
MYFTSNLAIALILSLFYQDNALAFMMAQFRGRNLSKLNIDKKIADMIDIELLRQKDRAAYNEHMRNKKDPLVEKMKEEFEQNRPIPEFFEGSMGSGDDTFQKRKDQKMLRNSPEKYCADRCLATGNCDILEDFFEMDAKQVVSFCEECVLGDHDECAIPETMLNNDYPDFSLRP